MVVDWIIALDPVAVAMHVLVVKLLVQTEVALVL